jgi:hypothetical protein
MIQAGAASTANMGTTTSSVSATKRQYGRM